MTDDLDECIASGLDTALSGEGSSPAGVRPRYLDAQMRSRSPMSVLRSIPTKAAVGLAAASLATGGIAAKAAVTGSANPLAWGQRVEQQVETCKTQAPTNGKHGIGDCVSDFAKTHGQLERSLHAHGKGAGGHAESSEQSNSSAGSTEHPGAPANHPGPPASHPGAPASQSTHSTASTSHPAPPNPPGRP